MWKAQQSTNQLCLDCQCTFSFTYENGNQPSNNTALQWNTCAFCRSPFTKTTCNSEDFSSGPNNWVETNLNNNYHRYSQYMLPSTDVGDAAEIVNNVAENCQHQQNMNEQFSIKTALSRLMKQQKYILGLLVFLGFHIIVFSPFFIHHFDLNIFCSVWCMTNLLLGK